MEELLIPDRAANGSLPRPVMKSVSIEEYHYVYGVVYCPLQVDTDWESMTQADVIKMAHDFIATGKNTAIDVMHNRQPCGADVVESFIARKGDPDYPEGSWVLATRIPEGPVWEDVKAGRLNGYSVDMSVRKVPKRVLVDIAKIAVGMTEENVDQEILPPHSHEFYAEFDSDGRITMGATTSELDHFHIIKGTVVTEYEMGHNHRFFVE
jgi:hypothetical protein